MSNGADEAPAERGQPPPRPLQTYGILTLVVGYFGRDYVLETRKYFISLL
jgi:hypothetical protein